MARSFTKPVEFIGEGSIFFGISLINNLLTFITFGFYRPWALTSIRKYLWENTLFYGSKLTYRGQGLELFKGFLIVYIFFLLYLIAPLAEMKAIVFVQLGFMLVFGIFVLPYAIFSSYRYRVSRTSWRGIHFSFNGNFKEYYLEIVKFVLMLILGVGVLILAMIYAHIIVKIVIALLFIGGGFYTYCWIGYYSKKYLISHTMIGNHSLSFRGEFGEMIIINVMFLFSFMLVLIPLALQMRSEYLLNNTKIISPDGQEFQIRFFLKPGEAYAKYTLNALLVIFTLGIGASWAYVNILNMNFNHIAIENSFNPDALEQDYTRNINNDGFGDAVGDEMGTDFGMDFGL